MIKNFQLLIHQVLDSVELNEKTFRDRGSWFKGRSVSPMPLTKHPETRGEIKV